MSQITHDAEKEVGGIKGWFWPTSDLQTWGSIKQDWEHTHRQVIIHLMETFGKKYQTVIQAGGNCGMYPRLLGQSFKQVYTFEPDPLNFFALSLNCAQDNIFKIQAALGAHAGLIQMVHRTKSNVGMHQVTETELGVIPMLTLDSMKFRNVDLMWLDIEDFEIFALQGAVETINEHQPILMCENPTEQVTEFLKDQCGYFQLGN